MYWRNFLTEWPKNTKMWGEITYINLNVLTGSGIVVIELLFWLEHSSEKLINNFHFRIFAYGGISSDVLFHHAEPPTLFAEVFPILSLASVSLRFENGSCIPVIHVVVNVAFTMWKVIWWLVVVVDIAFVEHVFFVDCLYFSCQPWCLNSRHQSRSQEVLFKINKKLSITCILFFIQGIFDIIAN